MKITGIIAEYDPLHPGHIRHMQKARAETGADFIAVALGGAFTQRGAPALFDRFVRAEMALLAGADIVVELPQVYACRAAEVFARGGVDTLDALGCDALSFGCETDDLSRLRAALKARRALDTERNGALLAALKEGKSYPRAAQEALTGIPQAQEELISEPNFILGMEYLRAMEALSSAMEPHAVLRSAPYHAASDGAASAGAVRRLIAEGRLSAATAGLPAQIAAVYLREKERGLSVPGALDACVLHALRTAEAGGASIWDEAEGLYARLLRLSRESTSVEDLIARVKCKRYTRARIERLIAAVCLNLPPAPPRVQYIRVLGFRKDARPLLKELSRRARLPLVTSAAELKNDKCFRAECRAVDLWGLSTASPEYRRAGREFTEKFIRI